jgi:hypothetical protein
MSANVGLGKDRALWEVRDWVTPEFIRSTEMDSGFRTPDHVHLFPSRLPENVCWEPVGKKKERSKEAIFLIIPRRFATASKQTKRENFPRSPEGRLSMR